MRTENRHTDDLRSMASMVCAKMNLRNIAKMFHPYFVVCSTAKSNGNSGSKIRPCANAYTHYIASTDLHLENEWRDVKRRARSLARIHSLQRSIHRIRGSRATPNGCRYSDNYIDRYSDNYIMPSTKTNAFNMQLLPIQQCNAFANQIFAIWCLSQRF